MHTQQQGAQQTRCCMLLTLVMAMTLMKMMTDLQQLVQTLSLRPKWQPMSLFLVKVLPLPANPGQQPLMLPGTTAGAGSSRPRGRAQVSPPQSTANCPGTAAAPQQVSSSTRETGCCLPFRSPSNPTAFPENLQASSDLKALCWCTITSQWSNGQQQRQSHSSNYLHLLIAVWEDHPSPLVHLSAKCNPGNRASARLSAELPYLYCSTAAIGAAAAE